MRRLPNLFAALAMSALAVPTGAVAIPATVAPAGAPRRERRRKAVSPVVHRRYRSRGAQAKPRRRSNRLHISRRVRRRHRRAR